MQIFVLIVSAFFILFLPGFFLSFVFFKWTRIGMIERMVLSFALSIALVPLLIFYTNLLGVKISPPTVMLHIAGISILTGIILLIQHWRAAK
jgi:uncharacterized membrane protein